MPFQPGQVANPEGKSGNVKPWADAIRRALARRADGDLQDINKLADKLLDKAAEGDLPALKELGDRLDGRPAQAITGPEGGALQVILQSTDAQL